MANYYINGENVVSGSVSPYDTSATGAPNFKTFFDNTVGVVGNGDGVNIVGTSAIDDSQDKIEINTKVTIFGQENTPVYLTTSGNGIDVNVDGVSIRGVYFKRDVYLTYYGIMIGANYVQIRDCYFEEYDTVSPASSYNTTSILSHGDRNIIDNCRFESLQAALFIQKDYCLVTNNYIESRDANITINTQGDYTEIDGNIINVYDNGVGQMGINGTGDYVKYNNNIIMINGGSVSKQGINVTALSYGAKGVEIKNNTIITSGSDIKAISLVNFYNGGGIYVTCVDNVLYNVSGSSNIAITGNVGTSAGFIDNNNVYGFADDKTFINTGGVGYIDDNGSKTIYTDPKLVYIEDHTRYPDDDDKRRYYCDVDSECVGAGFVHHNIGVGVDGLHAIDGWYINIIDTVTDGFGRIEGSQTSTNTFFNNVLTETSEEFNTYYRYNVGPYASVDVYSNQFGYSYGLETFPFENGDQFYNKEYSYILEHKGDLEPFVNINCSANPGYGYPEYHPYDHTSSASPNYDVGIFGYSRALYANGCELPFIGLVLFTFGDASMAYVDDTGSDGIVDSSNVGDALTLAGKNSTDTMYLEILEGTTELENDIFGNGMWDIDNTVDMVIPSTMVTIGNSSCSLWYNNLKGVNFTSASSLVTIGDDAFNGWTHAVADNDLEIPATLTSIGPEAFYNWNANPKGVNFTSASSLVTIGEYAFYWWSSATMDDDLVIPSKVTSIGEYAFYGWGSMTKGVDISEASSLLTIGDTAFRGWDSADMVDDVVIPSNVTSIGEYAFYGWGSMTKGVDMIGASSLVTIDRYAFRGWGVADIVDDVVIPSNVTSIGDGAFYGWEVMTHGVDFTSASSLVTIGDDAFNGWDSADMLVDLYIPSNITTISHSAFRRWGVMTKGIDLSDSVITSIPIGMCSQWWLADMNDDLVIPSGVISIGSIAFAEWGSMTKGIDITLATTLQTVDSGAFAQWTGAVTTSELVFPSTLTSIGSSAFRLWVSSTYGIDFTNTTSLATIGGSAFDQWVFAVCVNDLKIHPSVTSIGVLAFNKWSSNTKGVDLSTATGLTTITEKCFYGWGSADMATDLVIPSNVVSIDLSAFQSWSAMTKGVDMIGAISLTTITEKCFYGWGSANMTTLTIPASVTTIGSSAFSDWTSMTGELAFAGSTPPTFGGNCFANWSGDIVVTVAGVPDLSAWKVALDPNGDFDSINGAPWADIP